MNAHMNPLDDETKEKLKAHKSIFLGSGDHFVQYINHCENARQLNVLARVKNAKIKEFMKDESEESGQMAAHINF